MKILLLLLGWAMIGHGMWYAKGGTSKQNSAKVERLRAFSRRLCQHKDEILFHLTQHENEVIQERLRQEDEIERLRLMQPRDIIKIEPNKSSTIPDCHFPHTILYKYIRAADSITDLILCSTDTQVRTFAMPRNNIRITFTVCANEQMCQENYIKKGTVQSLDHELYIVPPHFEHTYISCCIEHPGDQEFTFGTMSFEAFMKKFDTHVVEATPEDSSGSDFLSSDEDDE